MWRERPGLTCNKKGALTCAPGFWLPTGTSTDCAPVPCPDFSVCDNPNIPVSCTYNWELVNGQCAVCHPGYYSPYGRQGSCVPIPCPEDWVCDSPDNVNWEAVSCLNGLGRINANNWLGNGVFRKQCQNCSDFYVAGNTSGYYLNDGNCVTCGPNVSVCDSNANAQECANTYMLQSGSCVPVLCPLNWVCNSANIAVSCLNNWELVNGQCSVCLPGFYSPNFSTGSCVPIPCPDNSVCEAIYFNQWHVVSCLNGWGLVDGQCLPCSQFYVPGLTAGYSLDAVNCVTCGGVDCVTCGGANATACDINGLTQECAPYFTLVSRICVPCPANSVCSAPNVVVSCLPQSEEGFTDGVCRPCPLKYYSPDGGVCVPIPCPDNSVCYSGPNIVYSCLNDWGILNGQCENCSEFYMPGIPTGYYLDGVNCDTCDAVNCVSCDEGVSVCDSNGMAQECAPDYMMQSGSCVFMPSTSFSPVATGSTRGQNAVPPSTSPTVQLPRLLLCLRTLEPPLRLQHLYFNSLLLPANRLPTFCLPALASPMSRR